jgi:hypothetical protein
LIVVRPLRRDFEAAEPDGGEVLSKGSYRNASSLWRWPPRGRVPLPVEIRG